MKGPAEIKATVTSLTKTIGQDNAGSAAITKIEGGAKPYAYQLDNGSFTQNTELNNLSGGVHTLLVKDANGCTTQVNFTIEATTDIEIPNGFTPNGDGINDTVGALKTSPSSTLNAQLRCTTAGAARYLNRWVTTWDWDGTFNNKRLPDGTYYCIIELGDGQPPLKKSVTIMR